jgi:hypothetical protein
MKERLLSMATALAPVCYGCGFGIRIGAPAAARVGGFGALLYG